jgi:hypothetical protein
MKDENTAAESRPGEWHSYIREPRLRPIPPNTETSSKSIRKMSNHFLDSSRILFLSMMATRKTPHTSHQISIREARSVYLPNAKAMVVNFREGGSSTEGDVAQPSKRRWP